MLLLACALCAQPGCIFGGQTGQDSEGRAPACEERRGLADDDASFGITPSEAAARFAGPFTASLAWQDGSPDSTVTVRVQYAGDAAALVRSGCDERLSLAVTLLLRTDDGRLDESLPATLDVVTIDAATLSADAPSGTLRGSYDDDLPAGRFLRFELTLFASGDSNGILRESSADEQQGTVVGRWPAAPSP